MQSNVLITGAWITINQWDRHDFLLLVAHDPPSTSAAALVHVPFRGGLFPHPLPDQAITNAMAVAHAPIAVLTAFACRLETLEHFVDISIAALETVAGRKRLVLTIMNCLQPSTSTARDPVSKWKINLLLKEYKKKYAKKRTKSGSSRSPVDFKIIFLNQPFSREVALNRAADELKKDELAVVLDVDMRVHSQFFVHCRTFTASSRMVYFPIPFVRLRPMEAMTATTVEDDATARTSSKAISIRKKFGAWDTSSHNTLSIASMDLRRLRDKGSLLFNANSLNWGMESEDLMNEMNEKGKLRVMRVYDPSLAHHYHKTDCKNVGGKICLGSSKLIAGGKSKLISHWDEV